MKQSLIHTRRVRSLLAAGMLLIALFLAFVAAGSPLSSDASGSFLGPLMPGQTAATVPRSIGTPVLTPRFPGAGTRTPAPSEFGTPPAVPAVASTPLPISQVIDLEAQLPEKDKAKIYVRRADGKIVVFLARFDIENSQLPLQPGDVVYMRIAPASIMGRHPPRLTEVAPTQPPYPGP